MFGRRTITMMGDGGFWHNGLTSGIANAVFNKNDGILVIMKNGLQLGDRHAGAALLPAAQRAQGARHEHGARARGIGVGWVKTVDNYKVGAVAKTLKEAMTTGYKGLKVIIADGECQLERQRKLRPLVSNDCPREKERCA